MDNRFIAPDIKINTFTCDSKPPSANLLDFYAGLYMTGFNQPPWDVYEFNFTTESACREFRKIVAVVLEHGGALFSLEEREEPAGFSIVTSLDIFVRELGKVKKGQKLPSRYENPGPYLENLARIFKISQDQFNTVGYIADIAVAEPYRGRGFSRIILNSSLIFLKKAGAKLVLAWTVNPAMAKVLSSDGFLLVNGVGGRGEGIDFTLYNRRLYPVLDMPRAKRASPDSAAVTAGHYVQKL
jgi:hypothetical protein